MVKRYFWNVLISLDQLLNTLLGGDPDETLSSRMGKKVKQRKCWACKLICSLLDLIQSGHCEKSIERDEGLPL
jgi:hypothetical protein